MSIARYRRNQIIFAAVAGLVLLVVVLLFAGVIPGLKKERTKPGSQSVTLTVWNVFEPRSAYADLIKRYEQENPHITIQYRKKVYGDGTEYLNTLTNAFAADEAPDIFALHNTWLPLQKDRLSSIPAIILTFQEFEQMFPDVVRHDFVRETEGGRQNIYALPLSVDTLALYYNETYFESENILEPPKNWDEFETMVRQLTQKDEKGDFMLAGAALGTAKNINRSTDILGLLMLQSGVPMTNLARTAATFDEEGGEALGFYTSFADPESPDYTWNKDMPYSIDAFVQGRAAMMFNYAYNVPVIKRKAPYLEFKVAPVPQPKDRPDQVNYANYWGFGVSKKSAYAKEAWDFILFMLKEQNLRIYLENNKEPTALRSLVPWQQNDPDMAPFAGQVLSAKSWYQGNNLQTELILGDMIENVVSGTSTVQQALDEAAGKVSGVFREVE